MQRLDTCSHYRSSSASRLRLAFQPGASYFVIVATIVVALWSAIASSSTSAQELTLGVQTGHEGPVLAMALSGDGNTLLTAGQDGFAQLWEVSSGRALRQWMAGSFKAGNVAALVGASLSSDGALALTVDETGWLDLRESATGKSRRRRNVGSEFVGMGLAPDGASLCVATNASLGVWPTDDTNAWWHLDADQGKAFTAFAQSEDGSYLAVADTRGAIQVLSARSGNEIWSGQSANGGVTGLAFGGDKNLLLVASRSPRVAVWNVIRNEQQDDLVFPQNAQSLAASRGGVVSAFDDRGHLMMMSLGTGAPMFQDRTGDISCAALGANVTTFMAGWTNGSASLCNIYVGTIQRRFQGMVEAQAAPRWFFRNVLAARGTPSNDLPPGAEAQKIVDGIYSPSGTRFAGRTTDGQWRLWRAEAATWGPLTPQIPTDADKGGVTQKANTAEKSGDGPQPHFSADSTHLLIVSGKKATIFETAAGEVEATWNAPDDVEQAVLSSDGRLVAAAMKQGNLCVWQAQGDQLLHSFPAPPDHWTALVFADAAGSLLAGARDGSVMLWKPNGESAGQWKAPDPIRAVVYATGAALGATSQGEIWRWPLEGDSPASHVMAHPGGVYGLSALPDGQQILSCGGDGALCFFDVANLAPRGRIYGLRDGGWLALESDKEYDSSSGATPRGLHFVRGLTTFDLSRVAAKTLDANWLGARFGKGIQLLAQAPVVARAVPKLTLKMPEGDSTTLQIDVVNQGGGIGPITVALNGVDIVADARGSRFDADAPTARLAVELGGIALRPGRRNWVRVLAQTSPNAVSPAEVSASWLKPGESQRRAPRCFGLFVGVSTTADTTKIPPLRFAAADAQDLALALLPAVQRQFGESNVSFRVFSSETDDFEPKIVAKKLVVDSATKKNLEAALRDLTRDAYEEDTVLIFLAGHGVTYDSKGQTYAFLTREARSGELADSSFRAQWALTGEELSSWVRRVTAGRVAIILDTCAAGASANLDQTAQADSFKITTPRDSYCVLAGSAATASSYEIPNLQHGVLTYALLEGLQGGALDAAQNGGNTPLHGLDLAKWLRFARDRSIQLASRFATPQKPILRELFSGQAPLGQFSAPDVAAIVLQRERPFVLPPRFGQNTPDRDDPLGLEASVATLLSRRSDANDASFTYALSSLAPDAIEARGIYSVQGDRISVVLSFHRGEDVTGPITVEESSAKIAAALALAIENSANMLPKLVTKNK